MHTAAASLAMSPSPVRLFTPAQVGTATFFGAPLGGSILMGMNYWRVGQPRKALPVLLLGLLSTAALVALSILTPEHLQRLLGGMPIACVMGMLGFARATQGSLVSSHVASGGKTGSGWSAAGIGLACAVVLFGGVVAALVVREPGLGEKIAVGPRQDVYFRGGISEGQARRVADVLKEAGYFPPGQVADVQLYREGQDPHVLFVFRRDAWAKRDATIADWFRSSGELVSQQVFDGRKLVVDLADESLDVYASVVVPGAPAAR